MTYKPTQAQLEVGDDPEQLKDVLLWDRKAEGGFPEYEALTYKLKLRGNANK